LSILEQKESNLKSRRSTIRDAWPQLTLRAMLLHVARRKRQNSPYCDQFKEDWNLHGVLSSCYSVGCGCIKYRSMDLLSHHCRLGAWLKGDVGRSPSRCIGFESLKAAGARERVEKLCVKLKPPTVVWTGKKGEKSYEVAVPKKSL
jgi:hypothetical protein